MKSAPLELAVVVPVFNERANVPLLIAKLAQVLLRDAARACVPHQRRLATLATTFGKLQVFIFRHEHLFV